MKKVLLLLATVMTAMSLWAAPVNLSTAKAKAQNYLVKEMYAGRIMSPAALEPVLLKAEMGLLNQPVFYIFNTESTFIVVAGDDRADEILMIGDRPLRNIDNLLNCGCIEYFEQMKKEGKITYFGFSSHAQPDTLRRFADAYKWDFAQIQMNYLDWEFGTAKEEYDILTKRNIPVIVMESVRGGRLSSLTPELDARLQQAQPGWSVSSWAFRWLMTHDNVLVMLSGMSNMEQVEDNLHTFEKDNALDTEQVAFLKEITHEFKAGFTVPCTSCHYCTPGCPMKLDIPELLKVYNDYKYNRRWEDNLKDVEPDKLPGNCIGCGSCTEHCPQNIDVPSYMAKLSKLHQSGQED